MFGRLITALFVIAGSAVFALGTSGTASAREGKDARRGVTEYLSHDSPQP